MTRKIGSFRIQQDNRVNRQRRYPQLNHRRLWQSLAGAGFAVLATALPMRAAEQIQLSYGLLEFDLPVDSLETYAQTGVVDSQLAFFDSASN